MAEDNSNIEVLLNPSPEQLQQEASRRGTGIVPERWLQIETAEIQRIRAGMEKALGERTENWTDEDVKQRSETARRYFGDLVLEPSFSNGPYAAAQWLNLYEMIPRVIDMKKDEAIVPDIDGRVPFHSFGLDKEAVISRWLIDQVQTSLPEDQKLRDNQLNDCFTNVSRQQLDAVVGTIAKSGLTLKPESPKEHWQRIVAESRPQK